MKLSSPLSGGEGQAEARSPPRGLCWATVTEAPLAGLAWPFSDIKGDGNTVFFLGVFTEHQSRSLLVNTFLKESGSAWGLSTMLGLV